MVKIWYIDNNIIDPRLECHKNPQEFVSLEALFKKTGVEYFKLNVKTYTIDGTLDRLKKERGYTYEDEIEHSKECMPNYEARVEIIFTEHLHALEEIRFVLEGSGYFDVRDVSDQWIRIAVSAGDMVVIPSGIYHRFRLDNKWNMKTCDTDGVLDRMMKERGYNIVSETLFSRESMPDYDESLKSIFIEHLHEEEETRLFLEGSGYFDVRDDLDQWIRIAVSSGDMLVLPCGIFHRFSPDIKDYVKMRSFSKREDMWIPYERPDGKADHMECRQTYLAKLQKGYFVAA